MKKIALAFGSVLCLMTLMINCSGQTEINAAGRNSFPYTYTTSSTKGDYAEWTFNGSLLLGKWQSLDANGTINYTYNIRANCPTYIDNYNYYTCTVDTAGSSCTEGPGAANCSSLNTLTLQLMESIGSSLSVEAGGLTANTQLFTGFVQESSCSTVLTGDYVFVGSGLAQTKLYGVQRIDSDFLNTTVAEFGLKSSGASATVTVQYLSENAATSGAVSYGNAGCTSGLRSRTTGAVTGHITTANGNLLVTNRTSMQTGGLAVKTTSVASASQLQNRTLSGFMYGDDNVLRFVKISTGSASGNIIAVTSADFNGTPISGLDLRALADTATVSAGPAYPNFTSTPDASPNSAFVYNSNTLKTTYTNPSSIPGTYRIEGFTNNDRILLTATIVRDKLMLYGVGYSWKLTTDTPPPGGSYPTNGYYSSYSLVLFEK